MMGRAALVGRLVLGLFALLAAYQTVLVARSCSDLRPVRTGDTAPDFELPIVGERGQLGSDWLTLSSLRGQVVVIDFWATWCGPCRSSMPVIDTVAREFEGRAVVLSVNIEGAEQAGAARRMADELSPTPTLLSDAGTVADRFKATTIPHLVVVGPGGEVTWVHRGFRSAKELDRGLRGAIEAALPP